MDFSDSLRDGFALMDFSDCGCDLDEEDKENALDEEAKESSSISIGAAAAAIFLNRSLDGSAEFSGVSCFSSRFDSPVAMTLADVAAVSDGLFLRASSSS
ncbi:hypothetical protein DY000_02007981 [Brassica cretica]|uniref:Uncharacterized protein n=1 Tax=Brassica cretica TaxID=69181 RepID=A0ABQ7CJX7_BRACR|nr:hypothetical protein DY000_02007981 [Brassica cretica]